MRSRRVEEIACTIFDFGASGIAGESLLPAYGAFWASKWAYVKDDTCVQGQEWVLSGETVYCGGVCSLIPDHVNEKLYSSGILAGEVYNMLSIEANERCLSL